MAYVFWDYTASITISIVLCLAIVLVYQHVVAFIIPNTIVMPAMDLQTFYSNPQVHINYMNVTQYDHHDDELFVDKFKRIFEQMPKFRYKIKCIAGDYYYTKMSI